MQSHLKLMRSSSFCLALLLFCTHAAGQGANNQAQKDEEQKTALLRKTFVLVDEVANGAFSLKLPENRSFVLGAAADLLWEHDQKRARTLFWDAINTLNLVSQSSSNTKTQDKQKIRNDYLRKAGLRRELLLRVTRRDPQFALDILRGTAQLIPEELKTESYVPSDREIEQEIAAAIVARDPKRSLEMARESLAKGLNYQVLELLSSLNQRNAELGSKLAGEVIAKIQTRNLDRDHFAARIALDLVLMSRPADSRGGPGSTLRPLNLEKEQRRELVQLISNGALSLSANPNFMYGIEEILPELEEFAPERVAPIREKVAAFNETLNKDQRGWNTYNSMVRNGSPEEMMRTSLTLSGDQSIGLQREAIVSAVASRRADSLRDIITSEVSDQDRRRNLLQALQAEEINAAVYYGKVDQLREMLPQISLREERARAMAQMAILLEKKGEHDEALKLLDEARTMIKLDIESDTQSNALMALIAGYAVVEPSKAFAIIEKAIDHANDQLSKLFVVDKIAKSGFIKKGELVLSSSGSHVSEALLFQYGNGVVALAKADFDRTKAAADRFSRNELRLMMRLMLAKSLIASTYKSETQKQP